jgi:hypothetical protein
MNDDEFDSRVETVLDMTVDEHLQRAAELSLQQPSSSRVDTHLLWAIAKQGKRGPDDLR